MTAAAALARAREAGVQLRLRPDGTVEVEADAPPPAALLDELREWRDQVAALLAEQAITPEPDASEPGVVWNDHERQALAAYYAEPPTPQPYLPSDRDQLRAGLLIASRMRPSAWSDPTPPTRGCWCAYCGNPQSGGRWWRPRNSRSDGLAPGEGWRCQTCRPIPPGCAVEVVET
jgi:hypothetical protein